MTTAEIIAHLRERAETDAVPFFAEAAERLEAAEATIAVLTEGQSCPYWDMYSPRVVLPWQVPDDQL